jgi:D-amino-acid dehydrogenase
MFWQSVRWALDPESPLYIKPRCEWKLAAWLWRFLRSMNRRTMLRSVAALTELSTFSLEAYRQLAAQEPAGLGFEQRGLLVVAQTDAGLAAARSEMELVGRHGIKGHEVDAAGIRGLEPALCGAAICGGVYFPNEAHLEPLAAVSTLVDRAERAGAKVHTETEVFEIVSHGRRIEGVRTTRGFIAADHVVLAAGAWSPRFARSLRMRIPMLSGKGYAVTLEPLSPTPAIPCLLIEKKIAVTPRASTIRLAGTLELVDLDESITARRVQAIVDNARQYLNVPASPRIVEVWRGLRPCTPDGMPIIGRPATFDNLTVATGHQMLGLQTAPATGRLVADLVLGRTPTFDPHPFRPDRF